MNYMSTQKKKPFSFSPRDWLKDTQLRLCSLEVRGLWIDILCLMHECTPYGYLKFNGIILTPATLSEMLGINIDKISKLLDELVASGICQIDQNNCYYSKRMVDYNNLREIRAKGGILGGNPKLRKERHD